MGTHPIFESDFDCLTVSNDMILRRRGGSLRVVVGTSIFWLSVFYTTSEYWCQNTQLEIDRRNPNHLPDDLKPAKLPLGDVIGDGIKKGLDAVGSVLSSNGPGENGAAVKIPPEDE